MLPDMEVIFGLRLASSSFKRTWKKFISKNERKTTTLASAGFLESRIIPLCHYFLLTNMWLTKHSYNRNNQSRKRKIRIQVSTQEKTSIDSGIDFLRLIDLDFRR